MSLDWWLAGATRSRHFSRFKHSPFILALSYTLGVFDIFKARQYEDSRLSTSHHASLSGKPDHPIFLHPMIDAYSCRCLSSSAPPSPVCPSVLLYNAIPNFNHNIIFWHRVPILHLSYPFITVQRWLLAHNEITVNLLANMVFCRRNLKRERPTTSDAQVGYCSLKQLACAYRISQLLRYSTVLLVSSILLISSCS